MQQNQKTSKPYYLLEAYSSFVHTYSNIRIINPLLVQSYMDKCSWSVRCYHECDEIEPSITYVELIKILISKKLCAPKTTRCFLRESGLWLKWPQQDYSIYLKYPSIIKNIVTRVQLKGLETLSKDSNAKWHYSLYQ